MRLPVLFFAVIASTPASALCVSGYDLQTSLDYLVCLHNEQSKLINQHAEVIDAQSAEIRRLIARVSQAEYDLADMDGKLADAETEMHRLKLRIGDLEDR